MLQIVRLAIALAGVAVLFTQSAAEAKPKGVKDPYRQCICTRGNGSCTMQKSGGATICSHGPGATCSGACVLGAGSAPEKAQ